MGETINSIAEMYSENPRRIKYFMKKNEVRVYNKFGNISDDDLENQVLDLFDKHPNVGM